MMTHIIGPSLSSCSYCAQRGTDRWWAVLVKPEDRPSRRKKTSHVTTREALNRLGTRHPPKMCLLAWEESPHCRSCTITGILQHITLAPLNRCIRTFTIDI